MKSLLDNNGVKRLVSNIKDWIESRFVDYEDRLYEPAEIELLVQHANLKQGKLYKIRHIIGISYNYNIGIRYPYWFIYLKAINSKSFDKKAILYDIAENALYDGEFQYGYSIYNSYGFKYPYIFLYEGAQYQLFDFYEYTRRYKFCPISAAPFSEIWIDSLDITNNSINIFTTQYSNIAAGSGRLYYSGLGTITHLKDDKGNEAPFDFINFKINNKNIITGSNNIIKTFDPENPTFINGNNNFVDVGCKNIEISGNRNFIGRNVRCVKIKCSDCTIGDNYQNYNNYVIYNDFVNLPSYSLEHSETNSYIRRIPISYGDIIGFYYYHNSNDGGELIFNIDIELRYIFENLFETLDKDNGILVLHNSDLSNPMIHIVDSTWDINDDFQFISDPDIGAESTIKKVKNKYIAHLCYTNTSIINSEAGEDGDAADAGFYIETDIYILFNDERTVLCGINVEK